MLIGITGQIGSGKSTVAALFRKYGAIVVDADRIGREVVERNPQLRRALVRAFGKSIIDTRGRIDRRRLAELAFASKKSKQTLDRLVHPHLLKELRRQVRGAGRDRVVVVDAALLLDWRMDREVDAVVLVHASKKVRVERLVARGISRADVLARIGAQLPYQSYLQRAHHLILNSDSPSVLEAKASRLWHRLVGQTD
jgi:dephospho-CoA kinase